jgi:glutamate N-acetyltransferase/amino-acid N-acetyltransferase
MRTYDTPRGYLFSVASAGIRYTDRPDMALIHSETDATVAGVFTRNRVKAAPVIMDIRKVRSGSGRTIIVNSGNANACTGSRGIRDAKEICKLVASGIGVREKDVLIASTGVIGTPLPMDRVRKGIDELISSVGRTDIMNVARSIMTTDRFPKATSRKIVIGKTEATLTGIAKGAGMISPDMATMLCFVITDLSIESRSLKNALKETVDRTFNLITVDGDMSTNDTVLLMANGTAGNRPLTEGSAGFRRFKKALFDVMDELSRMIVRDGEGATKLVVIRVRGAKSQRDARKAAIAVAKSSLVKTALYGRDANWGRIIAALGYSGAQMKEESTDISINGVKIVRKGLGTGMDDPASKAMQSDLVTVDINLNIGRFSERVYTCDLTEEYIKINAEYRT